MQSLLFPYYIDKIDAQLLITFMQGLMCPNNSIDVYRATQKELYLMWILQESKNTQGSILQSDELLVLELEA